MAALLVGMSVAAVLLTAMMPAWKQMTRRENETELVFRGQQYVRAIGLFQRRSGPGVLPPNVDVLVNGKFLRKKFKDPMTNQDFDFLSPTTAVAPGASPAGRGGPAPANAPQGRGVQTTGTIVGGPSASQPGGGGGAAGIIGVASKSKEASIRIYNGRTHYNEWQFIYVQQAQAPNAPGGAPGQRGAGPGGPPQRGLQPPPFGPGFQGADGRGRQGVGGRGNAPQGQQGGRGTAPGGPLPAPTSPFQPRR
ncbi:MAG TPA: hypothetical protein VM032_18675 [Vicinamibacterales bacterium]|nr:hypothetical protein [Vicinamibacterales bacterium]